MDPTIWGPKLWFFIHTLALNYPDSPTYNDKRSIEEFFNNLKHTLPCEKCKQHYIQRLETSPIINHLHNRSQLFKYTVDLHNQVNASLDKKIYSYEEALEIYKNHYDKNYKTKKTFSRFTHWINLKHLGISIIVLLIVIGGILYIKKKHPKRLILI